MGTLVTRLLRALVVPRNPVVISPGGFFNPITGALGADVAPCGAPVGSSIRNFWL